MMEEDSSNTEKVVTKGFYRQEVVDLDETPTLVLREILLG